MPTTSPFRLMPINHFHRPGARMLLFLEDLQPGRPIDLKQALLNDCRVQA